MDRARALTAVVLTLALASPASSAIPGCRPALERSPAGTWKVRPVDGLEGAAFTWATAADHDDPRVIVVADPKGALVTRDGGCTWERSLSFEDFLVSASPHVEDVEVSGTGDDRSFHVLVAPTNEPRALLSSFDDGATWSEQELPAEALPPAMGVVLSSTPAGDELYLLVQLDRGAGVLYAGTRGEWHRAAVVSFAGDAGTCAPDGTCTAEPLWTVEADPARSGALWGLGAVRPGGLSGIRSSADGGSSWRDVSTPELTGGPVLLEVAPGSRLGAAGLLLVGDHSQFAYSADGGASWQAGKLPELASADWTSAGAFDAAHFDGGRSFATVLGTGPTSEWAGNVLVFDGRRWLDASPRGFAGYDSPHTFTALTSTKSALLALSSRGELMSFGP